MLYPMAFAMGHNLPPLRGSEGRVDVKLALMGRVFLGSTHGCIGFVPAGSVAEGL
jgi:hypothetical protein